MKKIIVLVITILAFAFAFSFAFKSNTQACCGGWNWCCDDSRQDLYECSQYCEPCDDCWPPPPECTPGACGGCTPSCPGGQDTAYSGPYCQSGSVSSCGGSDGCNGCTLTGGACYYPETNTSFIQSNGSAAGPSNVTINVEGTTYTLSTDPNNPTVIKLPCSTSVSVATPAFSAPAISRGGGYYFQADNYGTDNQWAGWVSCSGTAGEDFCRDAGTTSSTSFTPFSLAVSAVLKEGAVGQISAQYYTINRCDDGRKYSTARVGYYRVETSTTVSAPTSSNIVVDGVTYSLSSNPASPTLIQLACTTNVSVNTPTFTVPANSASGGYYFKADNYGTSNQWLGGTACSGIAGEDFCRDAGTTNSTSFVPSSLPVTSVLKEGALGQISTQYYTTNRCGGNRKYSSARLGYYRVETNTPVSAPTSTSIIIDNVTYLLSSNSVTPTIVKVPKAIGGTVQLNEPTFTLPGYSKTLGYAFSADNYGTNNQWLGGTACTGIAGEDFCIENASNTQNFTPASKTIAQVLKIDAKGKIASRYYTTNRCGNNKQYSTAYNSYYSIDSEPTCIDCTPNVIITDLSTDMTVKECKSTTYTGKDIHNPLHFKVDVTDTNGLTDITGLIVWFSKDISTPSTVTITGTGPNADVANDIGIFIRKNGSNWSNPLMYGYDSTSTNWEQTADGNIKNTANETSMKLENIAITTNATSVTFDFKLEFFAVNTNPAGLYNLYLNGVDTYMINSNVVDQSRLTRYFNWGIDLTDPVAQDISQQVQDATNTKITWSVSDSISGISRTVINGYRVSGTEFDLAKLYLPPAPYTTNKGSITLNQTPASQNIGMYNDANSWIFINNTGETDLLNIGANEGGKIDIYATTYDAACNTNSTSEEIDLNSWFATRGGTVYSQNNISSDAKDVSQVSTLDGVFSTNTLMNKSLIDLGTELLATRNTTISSLIHSNFGAVRGALLYDSNNTKNYWFDQLMSKFSHRMAGFTTFQNITTSVSSDCPIGTICYNSSDEDINIPSGYVCDKPTLFSSKKNINIEPNVTTSTSVLSGCIFLAGNNINILDGIYQSNGSKIEYDYLEGFMIAEDQINFPLVDIPSSLRDGVEIFGGIIALGSTTPTGESAISIKRDLRLFSQINPAVVLTYDNKYSSIATIFFGAEAPLFRQEIGFKSF